MASYRDGVSDADIEAQAHALREEVESTQPLVGEEELPSVLEQQYKDNPVFLPKIAELSRKYRGIRRSRGDGSCFYRCLMIGLGEAFVDARVSAPGSTPADATTVRSPLQGVYEAVLSHVDGSLELLIALGYPESTVPDFYEAAVAYFRGLGAAGATREAAVYAPFRDQMGGFYILTYVRMLASLELLANEDSYLPYILGLAPHCATVKHFCDTEVEAVNTDADQIQIISLTNALKIGVRIAYLDASPGPLSEPTFPEGALPPVGVPGAASAAADPAAGSDSSSSSAVPLLVYLLYRPGHYDVAYPAAALAT